MVVAAETVRPLSILENPPVIGINGYQYIRKISFNDRPSK